MFNLHSACRITLFAAWTVVGVLIQGCSSYDMARLKRMNFSDDLYASADEGLPSPTIEPNSGGDPYSAYMEDGRSVRRSARSNRLGRYDRDLEWANRFGNPLWSNPGWNYGMGGFHGCRSYMLYNPFMPPYWGMNPGFSMGWGSPYGMNRPWGYDPWLYAGTGWGIYDPWGWNSWNSPWCNNWGMNSYWGWNNGWNNGWNGWNHGGSGIWVSATPALKPSPTRATIPGSSLPGFIQRGKMRAPARQPDARIGSPYVQARGVAGSHSISRSTTRGVVGSHSISPSTSRGEATRTLRSADQKQRTEVRYPYATPGTGLLDEAESIPFRSGSTGSSGSYTPRTYTPSRSGSTGSSGSYTPRTYTPSRSGSTGSSGSYTPRTYAPSRSGSTGSSGSYTPRTYTPSRSGSTGSSGSYTPRTSAPSAPSRTNIPSKTTAPSRSYTAPRTSGSYSPSAPSRSSPSGYSRPTTPSSSGGNRTTTSGRPR